MGGEDRGRMSGKARRRVPVMRQALEQQITPEKARELLALTDRPIRRLLRRVEQDGAQGRVHRGRGKPSNRGIPAKRKATVLTLYEERDGDGGPTLATEKLAERDGITLSDEILQRWLRGRGMDHVVRRKRPPRAWRARKAHVGELVQREGSHHDWGEGRGPGGCLAGLQRRCQQSRLCPVLCL